MSAASQSPRTRAEPMAFTRDEFRRGAMRAWGLFLVLLLAAEVVAVMVSDLIQLIRTGDSHLSSLGYLPIVLGFTLVIGGAISGLALLIGVPIAFRIATALRREARMVVHLTGYGLYGFGFGAVIGGASYAVAFAGSAVSVLAPALFAALIAGGLSAVAVTLAWWTIVREGLRTDRGVLRPAGRRRIRVDPDAAAEDSL